MGEIFEPIKPLPGEDPKKIEEANKRILKMSRDQIIKKTQEDLSVLASKPGEIDKVKEELKKLGVKFEEDKPGSEDPNRGSAGS